MNQYVNKVIMIPVMIIVITLYQILQVDLCKDPSQFLRFVKDNHTEIHDLTTKDGYQLTLFQILPNESLKKKNKVALVIHGILDSADTFAFDKNSVVHELLREGYEVWVGNNRGSKYSCTHKRYSNISDEYWDYSFQEMAEYDVPAFYEKILEKSPLAEISLIAHSQGATQSFLALSSNPFILKKTKKFVPLAPVLFMSENSKNTNILNTYKKYHISHLFKFMKMNSILLVDVAQNRVAHFVINLFCNKSSFVCSYLFANSIDRNPHSIDLARMAEYLSYCPSGSPIKSFEHFTQLIYSDDKPVFKAYDYGKLKNLEKYGKEDVDVYDISKIDIPIYLIHGETDVLSDIESNIRISEMNLNVKRFMLENSGHVQFTWGKDKREFLKLFNNILKL